MNEADVVYESVASTLLDLMEKENVENFVVKVFSTDTRDLQLSCEYLNGKSIADTLNEMAERIKALESIAYSVQSAERCFGMYTTYQIDIDTVTDAKKLLEDKK
jgi:hypothetical protein